MERAAADAAHPRALLAPHVGHLVAAAIPPTRAEVMSAGRGDGRPSIPFTPRPPPLGWTTHPAGLVRPWPGSRIPRTLVETASVIEYEDVPPVMVNAFDAAEWEEMRAPRTTGHDSAGYEDSEAVEAGPVTGEEAAQQVSRPDPNAASSNELREGHADRAEPENEPAEGGPVTGEGAAQQVPRPDPNPANSNELREGHEKPS